MSFLRRCRSFKTYVFHGRGTRDKDGNSRGPRRTNRPRFSSSLSLSPFRPSPPRASPLAGILKHDLYEWGRISSVRAPFGGNSCSIIHR